jgi:copper chaperone CopZ
MEAVLRVDGMVCGGCLESVLEAARSVDGVVRAEGSFEESRVVVSYDDRRVQPQAVAAAIAAQERGSGPPFVAKVVATRPLAKPD